MEVTRQLFGEEASEDQANEARSPECPVKGRWGDDGLRRLRNPSSRATRFRESTFQRYLAGYDFGRSYLASVERAELAFEREAERARRDSTLQLARRETAEAIVAELRAEEAAARQHAEDAQQALDIARAQQLQADLQCAHSRCLELVEAVAAQQSFPSQAGELESQVSELRESLRFAQGEASCAQAAAGRLRLELQEARASPRGPLGGEGAGLRGRKAREELNAAAGAIAHSRAWHTRTARTVDLTHVPPQRAALPPRAALVRAVFRRCDRDGNGFLDERELLSFATGVGFVGGDSEWAVEYRSLCRDNGADPATGVHVGTLAKMVDDLSDSGLFCTDSELESMLAHLEREG